MSDDADKVTFSPEVQQTEIDGDKLICFNFSGWIRVRKRDVQPHDINGNDVDVATMTAEEMVKRLNDGYFITLGNYLYDSKDASIEMSDFEVE